MAHLKPAVVTKPVITTLRDIEHSEFAENEKKLLLFLQDNQIPIKVDSESELPEGYVDIALHEEEGAEAFVDFAVIGMSVYHLTGWTKYSLPQEDSIIYGANTGDLDD